jgi:hypothetical protein
MEDIEKKIKKYDWEDEEVPEGILRIAKHYSVIRLPDFEDEED